MNAQVKRRKNLSATNVRNLRTLLLLSVFEPQEIGARLHQARAEAGLTQEEIADLVGVSTRSWQGYEAGDVVPYRHMAKIADVTRRSVAWLIHGDTEEPSRDPEWMQPLREELAAEIARLRGLNDDLEAELKPARPGRKRRAQ